jgi:hypothetical protein
MIVRVWDWCAESFFTLITPQPAFRLPKVQLPPDDLA